MIIIHKKNWQIYKAYPLIFKHIRYIKKIFFNTENDYYHIFKINFFVSCNKLRHKVLNRKNMLILLNVLFFF